MKVRGVIPRGYDYVKREIQSYNAANPKALLRLPTPRAFNFAYTLPEGRKNAP